MPVNSAMSIKMWAESQLTPQKRKALYSSSQENGLDSFVRSPAIQQIRL